MKTLTLTTTALIAALAVPTLASANPTAQEIFREEARSDSDLYMLNGTSQADASGIFLSEARSNDERPYAPETFDAEVISTQSFSVNNRAARIFAQQRAMSQEDE